MNERDSGNLPEELDERADDIRNYVERNSGRPSVESDLVDRMLEEAPPAEAASEIDKMVGTFQSGAGAATGRRKNPAIGESPTEDLPVDDAEK